MQKPQEKNQRCQKKNNKITQIKQEREELSELTDVMIINREKPKESKKILLKLTSEFIQASGYKLIYKNKLYFYILTVNKLKINL